MKMKLALIAVISAIAPLSIPLSAQADSRKAYCEYFENGARQAKVSMACIFSMRQGAVTITWQDGVSDYFRPIPDRAFVYTDERGGLVYQQRGDEDANGERSRIFKMENGSIYVWGS
ncbi:hypothetical protein H6F42_00905 [Pseudanabaena sp. FACHB-1998]|uniref:hypothetical protein n=1 Tax=Pseudanabaena sp. FACHB-1998 TaxID=2692858 RepID=UPI001680DDCE|nr:hypothetical protein [Pseudanabaena sp. FACHB-1998]MBD2175473.1 hypothetical protein [Pseudanabaena sp. FACHB-1998]